VIKCRDVVFVNSSLRRRCIPKRRGRTSVVFDAEQGRSSSDAAFAPHCLISSHLISSELNWTELDRVRRVHPSTYRTAVAPTSRQPANKWLRSSNSSD